VAVERDERDRLVRMVGIHSDITERKQIEKELLEKETRYQSFVVNSNEQIWCAEFSVPIPLDLPEMEQFEHILEYGYYSEANEAFAQVYGTTAEEVIGWPLEKTLPRSLPSTVKFLLEVIHSGYQMSDAESFEVAKDGSQIILLNNFSGTIQDGKVIRVWGTARDITKRKRDEQRILDYQTHLKTLASELTLVEERERRRIAAELHDNVGQTLALSGLQLETASRSVDDAALKEQLDELSETLLSAVQDTRHLIFELSSPTMNELGLGAAINEWVDDKLRQRHQLDVELVDKFERQRLDQDQSAILFRSVRELLTNIVKHARADKVSVRLEPEGENLRIEIKDNGIGFNVDQARRGVSSEGGLGLFSIEERMTSLGGSMVIDSKAHQGTTIVLTIPCSETTKETT